MHSGMHFHSAIPSEKIAHAVIYVNALENSHGSADVMGALKTLESLLADKEIQTVLAGDKELRQRFQDTYAKCLGYVSAQLTEVSRRLFVNLDQLDNSENDDITAIPDSHLAIMNAFEKLQAIVTDELVAIVDIAARTAAMERWVELMNRAMTTGDFFTAKAIYTALEVSAVNALKATREGLSSHAKKLLAYMLENYSLPGSSIKNMREKSKLETYIPNFTEYKSSIIKLFETFKSAATNSPAFTAMTGELAVAIAAQKKLVDTTKTFPSSPLHYAILSTVTNKDLIERTVKMLTVAKVIPNVDTKKSHETAFNNSAAALQAVYKALSDKNNSEIETRTKALKELKAQPVPETSEAKKAHREAIEKAIAALSKAHKDAQIEAKTAQQKLADAREPRGAKTEPSKFFKQDEFSTFTISGANEQVVRTMIKEIHDQLEKDGKAKKYKHKLTKLTGEFAKSGDAKAQRSQTVINSILMHIDSFKKNPEHVKQLIEFLKDALKDEALNPQKGSFGSLISKAAKPISNDAYAKLIEYIQRLLKIYSDEALLNSIKKLSVYTRANTGAMELSFSQSMQRLSVSQNSTPSGSRVATPSTSTPSATPTDVSRASTPTLAQSQSASTIKRKVQMSASPSTILVSSNKQTTNVVPELVIAAPKPVANSAAEPAKRSPDKHQRRQSTQLSESQISSANPELSSSSSRDKKQRYTMTEKELAKMTGGTGGSRHVRRKSLDPNTYQNLEPTSARASTKVKTDSTPAAPMSARSSDEQRVVRRKSTVINSSPRAGASSSSPREEQKQRPTRPAKAAAAPSSTAHLSLRLNRSISRAAVAEDKKSSTVIADLPTEAARKEASASFTRKFNEFEAAANNAVASKEATPRLGIPKTNSASATNSPRLSKPASHVIGSRQNSERSLNGSNNAIPRTGSSSAAKPASHSVTPNGSRQNSIRDLKLSGGATSSAASSPRLTSPTTERREKSVRELQGFYSTNAPQSAQSRTTSLRDVRTLDKKPAPPAAPQSNRDPSYRLSLRNPVERTRSVGSLRQHSLVANANATIRPSRTEGKSIVDRNTPRADAPKSSDAPKNGI